MRSITYDIDGPVFVADYGGTGPTMVLVHGLGGSHRNWLSLAGSLARGHRVLAPDLAGFGLSPRGRGRRSSVGANRRLLDRFIETAVDGPVILAGNSMGGLIALLEAADRPEHVAGLILVDPALPSARRLDRDPMVLAAFGAYMLPGVGQHYLRSRAARLGPEGLVRETLELCCADPSRIDPAVVAAHVDLARRRQSIPDGPDAFLEAARSIVALLARRARVWDAVSRVRAPTLLLHGSLDRLVPVSSAREAGRRRPDWSVHVLDGIGHIPQLEAPGQVLTVLQPWLAGPGAAAEARARVTTGAPEAAASA